MRRITTLIIFLFISFMAPTALGKTNQIDGELEKAKNWLSQRKFDKASQLLEKMVKKSPRHDGLFFLLGHTYYLQKKYDKVTSHFQNFSEKFPQSTYGSKAQFYRADAFAAQGDFERAVKIYQERARHLLSTRERQRLASIYLEVANQHYSPPGSKKDGHYSKALQYFKKALELELSREKSREVKFKIGYCHYRLNHYQKVIQLFDSMWSGEKVDNRGEIVYYLGLSYQHRKKRYQARKIYQDYLRQYSQGKMAAKIAYQIATTYGYPKKSTQDRELTVKALEKVFTDYPTSDLAPKALLKIGNVYYTCGLYSRAIEEYSRFLKKYRQKPDEKIQDMAAKALQRKAYSLIYQKKYKDGLRALRKFQVQYPNHPQWNSVQQKVISTEYAWGYYHLARKEYTSARKIWSQFLQRHPLYSKAPQILFQFGRIEYEKKKYQKALGEWKKLISKHPNSRSASHAQYLTGFTLEVKLKKYKEAIEVYKKVKGPYRGKAYRRIQKMKRTELSLHPEKIFRTNETPQVKVRTRNLKKYEIHLYSIDLEDYFTRRQTTREIEKLDVGLIEADWKGKKKVENYQKYAPIDKKVSLARAKAGLYVIKVVSGRLESTSTLVVSDLSLVVKASRQDLFVYTQNVRTNQPAGEVKLLFSDGKKIFLRGKTNGQGVFHQRVEKLSKIRQLRVLAAQNNSFCSQSLKLSNLKREATLQERGLVYTEKPAYRPGEKVHFRAIVRSVEKGQYALPIKKDYQISLFTPEGQTLSQQKLGTSDFGTFHGTFKLPTNAPLGKYRILVRDGKDASQTFAATFKVDHFQLDQLELKILPERRIYIRGDKVSGKISLHYFYGAPVAGKKVLFRLGSRPFTEKKTDSEGEIEFSLSTSEFEESQTLYLQARVPGEKLSQKIKIVLSPRAFNLAISTLRKTYLAGEKFAVTVKAKNLLNKPLARKVTLEVFRREKTGLQVANVSVQRKEMATDDSGEATIQISLDKGGDYLLRSQAKDRLGNRILAEKKIHISGKKDKIKLHILADQDTWKVGDRAKVKLASRLDEKGKALLTWESEVIHDYQIIDLAPGQRDFTFEVKDEHFPNFTLSMVLLQGNQTFEVKKEFKAKKGMKLTLKVGKKRYAPLEVAEVKIKGTDQQGQGVKAEVSVAVVNEALYQRYKEKLTDPASIFYRQSRGLHVRSGAGFQFEMKSRDKRVSKEVLDALKNQQAALKNLREKMKKKKPKLGYFRNQPEKPRGENFRGRYGLGHDARNDRDDPRTTLVSEGEEEALRALLQGTVYFKGDLTTNEKGEASVRFSLPGNITRYRVVVLGVTKKTLIGKGQEEFSVAKDFFISMKTPSRLRQGDEINLPIRLHNRTKKEISSQVKVTVKSGPNSSITRKKVKVPPRGLASFSLPYKVKEARPLTVTVEASGDGTKDRLARGIVVKPWGMPLVAGKAGIARGNIKKEISLPELSKGKYTRRNLAISIFPSFDVQFIKKILSHPSSLPTEAASRGLVLIAALDHLQGTRRLPSAEYQRLEKELTGLIQFICSSQIQRRSSWKGGWAFNQERKKSQPDLLVSAQSLLFLARAQKLGYPVGETYLKEGIQFIKNLYSKTRDDNTKAFILQVLSELGEAPFASLNRLYRYRHRLSVYGLSRLSLAFLKVKRKARARELAQLVADKDFIGGRPQVMKKTSYRDLTPYWLGDPVEKTALAVTVLLKTGVTSPKIKKAIEWLLSRFASQWNFSSKGMASFVQAVCIYQKKNYWKETRFELTIKVNEKFKETLTVEKNSFSQTIDVPEKFVKNKNAITLELSGKGRYAYSISLTGFTPGTVKKKDSPLKAQRTYIQAPPQISGKYLDRGWTPVEGRYKSFYNRASSVREGDWIGVQLRFQGFHRTGYVVVEEPLPAGVEVDPQSLEGNFDSYEIHPDRITFTFRKGYRLNKIQFRIFGSLPGHYRLPPTRVYALYQPWISTWGTKGELKVHPTSYTGQADYRYSPLELYQAGKIYFEKGNYDKAQKKLTKLYESHTLKEKYFKDTVRMLLLIHLKKGPAKEVVRHFENLKERYPELEVSFERILKVGEAYIQMAEYERGLYVFRGTLQASYLRATEIPGDLQQLGKIEKASKVQEDLFWKYPKTAYTGESLSSFAQLIYKWASQVEKEAEKKKFIRQAAQMMKNFLYLYPLSPIADEVAFSLANARLDLENLSQVLQICKERQKLHQKSSFLDDFIYLEGYASFKKKNYKDAVELFKKVAEDLFPSTKGKSKSTYANLSLYLIAQIFHATGQMDKALAYYGKITSHFVDAREVVELFESKHLEASETHLFSLKEKPVMALTYRNLKKVEYKIYPVNLLRFYLTRRSLAGVSKINLAGVKPFRQGEIDLKSKDRRLHKEKFQLPLKKAGAYLVVFKGENALASTMVVLSEIKLHVREKVTSGTVRVNILDRKTGEPIEDAQVKIIGSGNRKFRSGKTDVRGIFVGQNIRGKSTVIVQKGKNYSFYRGEKNLQNYRKRRRYQRLQKQEKRFQGDYLKKLRKLNRDVQGKNMKRLKKYFKGQKGVQIWQTK